MVLARILSSAASTSSFTNLVARVYFTRNPVSAAAVPNPISRWDFPVPESPIRHSDCPERIHPHPARVWMVAGLMFGFASKSKSASHLSRGNPAALTRRTERRRVHLQDRVHPHHRFRQRREPDQRRTSRQRLLAGRQLSDAGHPLHD